MSFVFPSRWAAVFAFQAAVSVAAGAFGAHALHGFVEMKALGWWQTGCQYLMYHSLAGLFVVSASSHLASYNRILSLFLAGNLLFFGSLCTMTLTGFTWFGVITPLGGLCYLFAWFALVFDLLKNRNDRS